MDFLFDMINMLLMAQIVGVLETKISIKRSITAGIIVLFWILWPEEIVLIKPIIMCEFMLMLLFFKGKFFQKIAWYVEAQMIIISVDMLLLDLSLLVTHNNQTNAVENYIVMARFVIISLAVGLLWKKRLFFAERFQSMTFKESLYIIFSLCLNIVIIAITQLYLLGMDLLNGMPVFAVCTLLFGFLQLVLCGVLQSLGYSKRKLKKANELNEDYIEQQKQYYMLLDQRNQELRRFRHDYNDQISVLGKLARDGKIEDIRRYIDELGEKKESLYYISTGNRIANAVMNHIYVQALEVGVKLEFGGKIPEEIQCIKDTDFCSVLSNALRNALEAASISEGKHIWVKASIEQGCCYIDIENTCRNVTVEEGKLVTTKKDRENHGLGMGNIQCVIEECGGTFRWRYADHKFSVLIKICYDRS